MIGVDMTPATVTVFNHLGEGPDGRAHWQATVVERVALFAYEGVLQYPARTAESNDRATVYFFFEKMVSARDYVDEAAFDALSVKTGNWTLHNNGRDILCEGALEAQTPPSGERAYRVISVARNTMGSPHMRHLKVVCK